MSVWPRTVRQVPADCRARLQCSTRTVVQPLDAQTAGGFQEPVGVLELTAAAIAVKLAGVARSLSIVTTCASPLRLLRPQLVNQKLC